MSRVWHLLDSGVCDAAFNMAMDEALLEAMPDLKEAVVRLYGWTQPAASFGYFQKYSEVAQLTPLRPLVRRPTGGGIVPHDADWTYSVTVPVCDPWYDFTARESYRAIHEWLCAAFAEMGVETQVAAEASKVGGGQCFVGHEQYDLLWRGRKIAGAAQRRTRSGLLIQGSVQPPAKVPSRAAWDDSMRHQGERLHGLGWHAGREALRAVEQSARRLTESKYARDEYNRKR